jgi:hypothetical protein
MQQFGLTSPKRPKNSSIAAHVIESAALVIPHLRRDTMRL